MFKLLTEIFCFLIEHTSNIIKLTLKAPFPTAADDKFCDIFLNFPKKYGMIADDYHEISRLICFFFEKAAKFEIVICCKL